MYKTVFILVVTFALNYSCFLLAISGALLTGLFATLLMQMFLYKYFRASGLLTLLSFVSQISIAGVVFYIKG